MKIFSGKVIGAVLCMALCSISLNAKEITVSDSYDIQSGEMDDFIAPVHTRDDLIRYMPFVKDSPLDKLPAGTKSHFLDSLIFSDKGVISYYYQDLRDHMGAADIYRVLSMFGLQKTILSIPDLRIESDEDRRVENFLLLTESDADFSNRSRPDYVCDSGSGRKKCVYSVGWTCPSSCR